MAGAYTNTTKRGSSGGKSNLFGADSAMQGNKGPTGAALFFKSKNRLIWVILDSCRLRDKQSTVEYSQSQWFLQKKCFELFKQTQEPSGTASSGPF